MMSMTRRPPQPPPFSYKPQLKPKTFKLYPQCTSYRWMQDLQALSSPSFQAHSPKLQATGPSKTSPKQVTNEGHAKLQGWY